ncbi:hypothetical protein BGZ72_006853 [Mortierella alpina]|nr:hypothetical protein BGZ72_006853 [Mortierella alpina]
MSNPNQSNHTNTSNGNGTNLNDHGTHIQHGAQGHPDLHGQPAVPLMHRTVDELLSAEFPLGNVRHAGGGLNNSVQGNLMEGLDDLFSDDFPAVNTSASTPGMTSHHLASQPQQALIPPMHYGSHSPQKHSPLQQHQQLQGHHRILQQGTGAMEGSSAVPAQTSGIPVSVPGHLSHSPQVSPAMAHAAPTLPQLQQNRPQHHSVPGQSYQSSLTMPTQQQRPIFQQQPQQQQQSGTVPPRPGQSSTVQMPPTAATQVQSRPVSSAQPATPTVARPAATPSSITPATAAPSIPIAQAGSPLHHILTLTTPAVGQQLSNLFNLLQTNAVTPSEFLARAQRLLEPAHFEILDGIRRRHGSGTRPAGGEPSSPTGSSPGLPPSGSGSAQIMTPTTTATSAAAAQARPSAAASPSVPMSASSPMPITPTLSASQSAPVRKRNVETTSAVSTPTDSSSKLASKRVKTEQAIVPGSANSNGSTVALPSTPSSMPSTFLATPGSATPGVGGSSPGAFKGVSLPGQQPRVAPLGAGAGAGGVGGSAAGAGHMASSGAGASSTRAGASGTERVNYDNITDVMGYVAVDLREETDNILRENDGSSRGSGGVDGQDRTRVQNFVNADLLKKIVERIASPHKLQSIEPDVLAYLAMAAQERLRGLAEQMILASKHRAQSLATAAPPTYDGEHAMYKVGVNQDVKKQLLAIERVEREEETKRKEQIAERERRLATGEGLDENGEPRAGTGAAGAGGAGAKKGKKQKEGGPGVSARNMSVEAQKKVANQTALGFVGGTGRSYSWMMGGGGGAGGAAGGAGAGAGGGAASPLPSAGTPAAAASPAAASSPSASGGALSSGSSKPSLARSSTMTGSAIGSGAAAGGVGSLTPGLAGSANAGLSTPSLARGASAGGGSMILPPSTLGRPTGLKDTSRKVNIRDALFCLERDRGGGGGQGSGQRVLVKSYVKWLK